MKALDSINEESGQGPLAGFPESVWALDSDDVRSREGGDILENESEVRS